MSKFRIAISPSRIQHQVNFTLLLVLLLSVWSWKQDVLPYQMFIQAFLTLILLFFYGRKFTEKPSSGIASVSEAGLWTWLSSSDGSGEPTAQWRVMAESKMTPWWHWVTLLDPISNKRKTHIIYKDSVSDENWRHLSRIIKQQKFSGSANPDMHS